MSTSATPSDDPYPLHTAARLGHLPIVESLLSTSPKLAQKPDADDRLPQHWATSHSHLDILRLLASQPRFDPDAVDASGWTCLMMASSLPSDAGLEIVNFLLKQKEADSKLQSNSGGTALHFAASKGNLAVVRALLETGGASARVKDKRGQTALMRAAAVGSGPIVKALLKAKAPVNASDVDGCTALHHAVSEGHGDVAVELIREGAEVGKRDADGRTALEGAPDERVRGFVRRGAEAEGVEIE